MIVEAAGTSVWPRSCSRRAILRPPQAGWSARSDKHRLLDRSPVGSRRMERPTRPIRQTGRTLAGSAPATCSRSSADAEAPAQAANVRSLRRCQHHKLQSLVHPGNLAKRHPTASSIRCRKCPRCLRTPVHLVSGLYRHGGGGRRRSDGGAGSPAAKSAPETVCSSVVSPPRRHRLVGVDPPTMLRMVPPPRAGEGWRLVLRRRVQWMALMRFRLERREATPVRSRTSCRSLRSSPRSSSAAAWSGSPAPMSSRPIRSSSLRPSRRPTTSRTRW